MEGFSREIIMDIENVFIECKERSSRKERLAKYTELINEKINENSNSTINKTLLKKIIDKESGFERRIYLRLKKWKENHPLIAILVCTILGVIVLNLLAGIVLEAFIMYVMR